MPRNRSEASADSSVLDSDDQREHALALAYRYLNRRERTEAEVRSHLNSKELDHPAAEQAICTLQEQGYLDDRRYALMFIQDKRRLEQWGNQRIKRALLARGIEREIVEATLAEEQAGETPGEVVAAAHITAEHSGELGSDAEERSAGELGRAITLLRKRFPCAPRDRRERERALGMLLRKGYESDLATEAVSSYARDRDAATRWP